MKKIVAWCIIFCLCFGIVEVPNVKAISDINQNIVFNGEGFQVRFETSSIWNKGYIGNIYIKNTGSETIENWELSYQSADQYTNIWNGVVDYRSAKYYNIKNAGHNQNIKPGETVTFGFQASFNGEKPDIPEKYSLVGDHLIINKKDCVPKFEVVNSWKDGCIMNVSLFNASDKNIEDWALECKFDFEIANIWRTKISNKEGNGYTFKNCEYNSIIRPGETETFGMQVSFEEDSEFKSPYDVVLTQYRKDDYYMDFDKNWNVSMIRADDVNVKKAAEKNKNTVKVCMLDSGIDYSSNVEVEESIDLTDEYEDRNPIFEDVSGHGTAVAGILASDPTKNEEGYDFDNKYLKKMSAEKVSGINPYIQLYSAEILDDNNETTVDKMVEGIEWAIEKDVKIINISCGLEKDSTKLHNAIKIAKNKGILIIAAAGNGSNVCYPAKYPEVMAVGAVKCDGTHMKDSPIGDEIEVVAPGEDVTTYGPFDILSNESGTSMATPHVSSLAALLWQQDSTKSAEFIRELIKVTANTLGSKKEFGYGLIDCSFALEKYDEYAKSFNGSANFDVVEDNDSALILTDDSVVKGFWNKEQHKETVFGKNSRVIKRGAVWPDKKESGLKGMVDHPQFHGYFKKDYINAYIQLTKVASKLYSNPNYIKKKKSSKRTIYEKAAFTAIKKNKLSGKENISAFVYGMALHTAADIFSHSAAGVKGQDRKKLKKKSVKSLAKMWNTLKHGPKDNKGHFNPKKNMADSTKCINSRYYKGAKKVCSAILNQIYNNNGHKKATKKAFEGVKYYQTVAKVKKIKKSASKKNYLINSYGILNLNKYLKPGKNKKLKKIVDNMANKNVKGVVNAWK